MMKMDNIIYLDNAASTRPRFFTKDYAQYWMNPNSPHQGGIEANQALTQAKDRIKQALGVSSGAVLFCRCASEAVEWLCRNLEPEYIACCKVEHDSVWNCCWLYEDMDDFDNEVYGKGDVYLHQHTNPITGTIFDIESIGKQVQSAGAFFGSDITASLGHYPLPANLDSFCDCLFFSGRKIHCETMGAIWLSDRLFEYLGGDETHMITGTPNVPGALALADAVEYAVEWERRDRETKTLHYYKLFTYLAATLAKSGIEFEVVESKDYKQCTCAINAITLYGVNADTLVQYLSTKSIYISPGHSACADSSDYRILEAFGLTKQEASETVRISFDEDTAQEEIDALVQGIVEFKNLFI